MRPCVLAAKRNEDVNVNATYLLENSLLEPGVSCDGEPAPDRVVPAILADGLMTPDIANADLTLEDSEEGTLTAVGEVEA